MSRLLLLAAGLVALVWAEVPLAPEAGALAADDECLASGDSDDCALNALQLRGVRRHKVEAEADLDEENEEAVEDELLEAKPKTNAKKKSEETTTAEPTVDPSIPEEEEEEEPGDAPKSPGNGTEEDPPADDGGECNNSTKPCDPGWHCVSKNDGSWTQCVTCEKDDWEKSCVKWPEEIRYNAIKACKLTCPDSKCVDNTWCPSENYKCAFDKKAGWGQCIKCNKDFFTYHCGAWTAAMQKAAAKVCGHKKGQECKYR